MIPRGLCAIQNERVQSSQQPLKNKKRIKKKKTYQQPQYQKKRCTKKKILVNTHIVMCNIPIRKFEFAWTISKV